MTSTLGARVCVVSNPATGDTVGTVSFADTSEIESCVAAGLAAQRRWGRTPRHERYSTMLRFADLVQTRRDELATTLTQENGKPLDQAYAEVETLCRLFRGFAERMLAMTEQAHFLDSQAGLENDLLITQHEPLGLIAAIVPFNFPLELFAHKVAPAIAMGNAVVVKPSPEDPLAVMGAVELLAEAGLPEGVVQAVNGDATVGAALVSHPDVAAVSFTGSTEAGISIAGASAKTLKRVMLELGGNDALVILDDADIELAVDHAVVGRTWANGQVCCANKRILADASVADEVTSRLVAKFEGLRVGDPLELRTQLGPLIHDGAAQRVAEQVDLTVTQGAKVATGGNRNGAFYAPTVLTGVDVSMDIARDMEVFGPVLPVIAFDDVHQAAGIANATRYGLSGSVFSADVKRAMQLANRMTTGQVIINGTGSYRPDVAPFGGVRYSGNGREGLSTSLHEFVQSKAIVLRGVVDSGPF